MLEAQDALMTLHEIRRRYFAKESRPPKKKLVSWITSGDDDVFLEAVLINGVYYVRKNDFEAFLERKPAPTSERRARRRDSLDRRVDAALARAYAAGVKKPK